MGDLRQSGTDGWKSPSGPLHYVERISEERLGMMTCGFGSGTEGGIGTAGLTYLMGSVLEKMDELSSRLDMTIVGERDMKIKDVAQLVKGLSAEESLGYIGQSIQMMKGLVDRLDEVNDHLANIERLLEGIDLSTPPEEKRGG